MSRDAPEHAPDSDGLHGDPEVPAAVLCAVCRRPDCQGCDETAELPAGAIPWEGRGGTGFGRLWGTARLVSPQGEAFFGELAAGEIGGALLFATLCELFAIGSLIVLAVPLSYVLVPELVTALAGDPTRRVSALVTLVLAAPGLAALMVFLHLVWGGALELGVRFSGNPARLSHGLRYGLYACGWDLMTSPFGFVAASVTSGIRSAPSEVGAAMRVPRIATRAYLARARGVETARARIAILVAALLTGVVVLLCAIGFGIALVIAMV